RCGARLDWFERYGEWPERRRALEDLLHLSQDQARQYADELRLLRGSRPTWKMLQASSSHPILLSWPINSGGWKSNTDLLARSKGSPSISCNATLTICLPINILKIASVIFFSCSIKEQSRQVNHLEDFPCRIPTALVGMKMARAPASLTRR